MEICVKLLANVCGMCTQFGRNITLLSQVRIERLGYNFGNCTYVTKSDEKRNVYEEHYPVSYSSNVSDVIWMLS